MTSFRVQFEKWGCGLLREGKRREGEWASWFEGESENRKCILLSVGLNTEHWSSEYMRNLNVFESPILNGLVFN